MASPGDWVLIRYDVPGPEIFHERVVTGVCDTEPSLIATFTNDGDHYAEDVSQQNDDIAEVRWIARAGDTPAGIDPRRVYRFRNPPDAALMEQLKRDGALMVGGRVGQAAPAAAGAAPHAAAGAAAAGAVPPRGPGIAGVVGRAGGAAPPAPPGSVWVATENYHGYTRGQQLPDPLPDGSTIVGDCAVVELPAGKIVARLVARRDLESYVVDDLRVMHVKFNNEGVRRRPFAEAVDHQVADEPEGGVMVQGPRTALPLARSWRDAGLSAVTHHESWVRGAKIPDGDRSVHEHEMICRVMESMLTVDQLNIGALQSAELLARRLQLIEDAHRGSPSNPDYSAAELYMGLQTRKDGASVVPAFQKYVAEGLKDEVAIQKEKRKAKEEAKLRKSGKHPPGGAGGSGG